MVRREQRCSEQLVLYAKVIHILYSLTTRYEMESALDSQEDPPRAMKESKSQML